MSESAARRLASFATRAAVPAAARARALRAFVDTVGVMLAGSVEPVARLVQALALEEGGRPRCRIAGTPHVTGAGWAAMANGAAAHALDYDDMCFVSLAHPSATLVPACLAAGELDGTSGAGILDAYVVGFEIECVLGRVMNPRHYTQGWHCTSTLGALGAAGAAARLLGLSTEATAHALAIAASEASGLKENFGTMTKPYHAGMAARSGIVATLAARSGLTAAERAIDGPQGYLTAMSAEREDRLPVTLDDLGRRWEILETGITVKLYPSCAGTHPALDALLDLRRRYDLSADAVDRIEVDVDEITPTVLIHERPASGLEGKFSLHFCAAAALAIGRVDLDTFTDASIADERVRRLMPSIAMHVDPEIGHDRPALTQARVTIRLRDGRSVSARADGARGYPDRPASDADLDRKFADCASRVLDEPGVSGLLNQLRSLDRLDDIRSVTRQLTFGTS